MKKHFALLLAFLLVSSLVALAGDATGAPKLIRITRYDVAPGKMSAMDEVARQVRASLTTASADYHWIAAKPITGNSNQAVFLNFYNDYASLERGMGTIGKALQASMQNAEFTRNVTESQQSTRSTIARLREDLSYNLDKFDIANARSWEVSFVEVRPGHGMDFSELERESVDLHKRGNIDETWAAYEVEYGPSNGIIYLTPLRSLADLDRDLKAAHEAVFTPAVRRRFSGVFRDAVDHEKSEILAVRPEISRPTEAIVAANPDFWTVKEEAPAVASMTKGKKAGKMQPAVQKSEAKK